MKKSKDSNPFGNTDNAVYQRDRLYCFIYDTGLFTLHVILYKFPVF
ncbi:MAG: hypothetical protein WBV73_14060 [Phormidium sp.]